MTADAVTTAPFNVLDPAFYVDPWDAYRWLREEAPVYWDPIQKLWVISRYEDIIAVELDAATYSSFNGSRPLLDLREDQSIINMDDPEHQAQRNLVARRFTPGAVRNREEFVRSICSEILDDVVTLGECEAIEAIASRLPAIVIGDLLGYPRELWTRLRHWAEQTMLLAGQTSPDGPPHVSHAGLGPLIQDFFEVTTPIIEARRTDPRDDLISVWATTEGWDTGHVLDETILVLNGGAETTRTVIGSMIRELALQPEQRQRLIDHPDLLLTSAVDEFIRWVTPVSNMSRTVTVDHELHDQQLHKGDGVLLLYGAANRDPSVFEDPDVLDVERTHTRHVSFGFGSHFCLGAHVARLEIRLMFEEMLKRIPDWELVDPDEPRIEPSSFARAYDRIRIRFTPS